MYRYFLTVASLCGKIVAHSWTEQLTVIGLNGTFEGQNGYPRGYVARYDANFADTRMTYLLPPAGSGRTRVDSSDLLCAPTQRNSSQVSDGYPRLKAAPGSYVALKYLENGHVTMPQNQPGKPPGAGTVYVFGTSQARNDERLLDVLRWTEDGAGGDRRGRLLTSQDFDDGRCYQINNSTLSAARRKTFPNPLPGQPGSRKEQWCEADIMIPPDVAMDSTYTVYWVWQWPTTAGGTSPDGKDECYTTCSDIDVGEMPQGGAPNPLRHQDPQLSAVPGFASRAAGVETTCLRVTATTSQGTATTKRRTTTATSFIPSGTPGTLLNTTKGTSTVAAFPTRATPSVNKGTVLPSAPDGQARNGSRALGKYTNALYFTNWRVLSGKLSG
jgi:hypothetical protein